MNSLATRQGLPLATWIELWEELQGSTDNSQPLMPVSLSLVLMQTSAQLVRGSLGMRLHVSGALLLTVVEDGCGVGWMSGGGRVDGCRGGG